MIRFVLALVAALAQAAPAPPPKAPAPAPTPTPSPVAPPYEADLLRLSELLGALSFLRDLCHEGDGGRFREALDKLLLSEARSQETKDELAGAFNRGFDGYRLSYRTCTSNAQATIEAFLAETRRRAAELASRFGS